jgi:hypothetical protein
MDTGPGFMAAHTTHSNTHTHTHTHTQARVEAWRKAPPPLIAQIEDKEGPFQRLAVERQLVLCVQSQRGMLDALHVIITLA